MKIPTSDRKFEACPEFKGRAVCVDVTPLRRYETQYGPKDKFKLVFEVDLLREDGSPFAVWSMPMTPSSHENAAFAKFMKDWSGKTLTKAEWGTLDTEDLIGRPADMVVVREFANGETYANIKLIMPDKSADPLKPSGKYVRAKDRQAAPAGQGGYRRVEQAGAGSQENGDLGATKIHVGKCKGLEVRDLAPQQVQALIEHWLPTAKANPKPLADDRRLIAALEWWAEPRPGTEPETNSVVEEEDVPY